MKTGAVVSIAQDRGGGFLERRLCAALSDIWSERLKSWRENWNYWLLQVLSKV